MQLRATFTASRRHRFIVIFERDGADTGTSVAADELEGIIEERGLEH